MKNAASYRITQKAVQDLEEIWLYTYNIWSKEQADRYYNLLISEMEYISQHFNTGRSMERIKQGYRASKVKSHLIFYRMGEDGATEIIRVLHERMDIRDRLK